MAPAAFAQGSPAPVDSFTTLAPVMISAEAPSIASRVATRLFARAELTAMARENASLERVAAQQNREIAALEARLLYLRTVVTDSLESAIASLDRAALETRVERLRLEARLRALEGRTGAES